VDLTHFHEHRGVINIGGVFWAPLSLVIKVRVEKVLIVQSLGHYQYVDQLLYNVGTLVFFGWDTHGKGFIGID
jgi:hypothetical protein